MSRNTQLSGENTKYKDGVNQNARLIVRNVSFKATEDSLREHFAPYGSVEEVKLLRTPDGKLVGCGFVHFTHVPMANKALAATNKKPFLGRPLYVAWAVAKQKYDSKAQDKPTNKRYNSELSGESNIKIKEDPEDVVAEQGNSKIRINRNARLIVRNISYKATEQSLKEHFEPYGHIIEVNFLKKPDGKLVGCAFVHFKNVPMAKKALLSTNMKPFLGRPISVDWAVAKNKYMQHMVNQQLDMEDKVKKEESDSEDERPSSALDTSKLKQEIKSESEDSKSDDDAENDESDDQSGGDDECDNERSDDEDQSDDEDLKAASDDDQSQISTQIERKRTRLNDAEDGCTVFVSNLPFVVDNDQLRGFAERSGPVKYALVCVDRLTEHSKGTAFIKFVNKEDADNFLALPPEQLKIEGQVLQVKPALKRENLQKGKKKEPKDNRNLYLVKEGVIVAGTKAAVGVSASDMSKRLALERSKTEMLRNLNRFVSRYRLVVSNVPAQYEDAALRRLCAGAAGGRATLTEARVMRDLRAPLDRSGRHPSKGYGFVMFTRHEDALACLRKLNNNPDIFDKNNRPIVSFSIEDRIALNARKKRLEKSIANNPVARRDDESGGKRSRKRKLKPQIDESYVKKGRLENKTPKKADGVAEIGKFVRPLQDDQTDEYAGLTTKQGSQHKMRNNHKLKMQAVIHRQATKLEKKKSKRTWRLKMAARERIKQPKQKINKNPIKKRRKNKNKSFL